MRVAAFCTALAATGHVVALAATRHVVAIGNASFLAPAPSDTDDMHHNSGPYMRFRNRAMRVRSPVSHR